MIDTYLREKVVIVTGANHGIGEATAISFAKQGCKVFMNYLRLSPERYGGISLKEAEKATEPGRAYYYKGLTESAGRVTKAIQESGSECSSWEADLANPENIHELFDKAEEKFHEVLSKIPEDVAAELYLQRIANLREEPPGPEWDGVFTMRRKQTIPALDRTEKRML